MIKVKNYNYAYNSDGNCLEDINMDFKKGFMYAVIGPSGVGKSTLFASLIGFAKGTGSIKVGNTFNPNNFVDYISSYWPFEYKQGLVWGKSFKEEVNDSFLNFSYIAALTKESSKFSRNKFDKYLERFNLKGKNFYAAGLLSRGEVALVELAVTLAFDTEVYLLDEPFSNIDYSLKIEVMKCLKEKVIEGKCVILSSHNINILDGQVDYIYFMKDKTNLDIIETSDVTEELSEMYKEIYGKEGDTSD